MKKILALIALVGAAAVGAAVFAKQRGQDLGEFAGEWADRAKEVAGGATSATDDAIGSVTDDAIDLRADEKVTDGA